MRNARSFKVVSWTVLTITPQQSPCEPVIFKLESMCYSPANEHYPPTLKQRLQYTHTLARSLMREHVALTQRPHVVVEHVDSDCRGVELQRRHPAEKRQLPTCNPSQWLRRVAVLRRSLSHHYNPVIAGVFPTLGFNNVDASQGDLTFIPLYTSWNFFRTSYPRPGVSPKNSFAKSTRTSFFFLNCSPSSCTDDLLNQQRSLTQRSDGA